MTISEMLDYIKTFAQFPFALRHFLKPKLTVEAARRIMRERIDWREENFLQTVAHCV